MTETSNSHHAPAVNFRLLGPFSVRVDGVPVTRRLTGPAQHLLIYLLLNAGQKLRREYLIDQIWPEDASLSRAALNTALWRMRRFISPFAGVELDVAQDTLRLRLGSPVQLDTAELCEAAACLLDRPAPDSVALSPSDRDALTAATARWRGPFADGLTHDWALVARERLHNTYLRALTALMRSAGQAQRFERALEYGQRILLEDPFRESVHCEVMWLLVLTGQRVRAIRSHAAYCKLLQDELGIQPMAETQALHDYVRTGLEQAPRREEGARSVLAGTHALPQSARRYLSYLDAVDRSRAKVYDALRALHPTA